MRLDGHYADLSAMRIDSALTFNFPRQEAQGHEHSLPCTLADSDKD